MISIADGIREIVFKYIGLSIIGVIRSRKLSFNFRRSLILQIYRVSHKGKFGWFSRYNIAYCDIFQIRQFIRIDGDDPVNLFISLLVAAIFAD